MRAAAGISSCLPVQQRRTIGKQEVLTTARSWHQTEQAVSEGISMKANMATQSAAERL